MLSEERTCLSSSRALGPIDVEPSDAAEDRSCSKRRPVHKALDRGGRELDRTKANRVTGEARGLQREQTTAGKGWAIASLVLGLMAGAGPTLYGALARVLPLYRNPVDLTWAGFASWASFSAAALAGFLCALTAHRRTGRRGRWARIAWVGGGISAIASHLVRPELVGPRLR